MKCPRGHDMNQSCKEAFWDYQSRWNCDKCMTIYTYDFNLDELLSEIDYEEAMEICGIQKQSKEKVIGKPDIHLHKKFHYISYGDGMGKIEGFVLSKDHIDELISQHEQEIHNTGYSQGWDKGREDMISDYENKFNDQRIENEKLTIRLVGIELANKKLQELLLTYLKR